MSKPQYYKQTSNINNYNNYNYYNNYYNGYSYKKPYSKYSNISNNMNNYNEDRKKNNYYNNYNELYKDNYPNTKKKIYRYNNNNNKDNYYENNNEEDMSKSVNKITKKVELMKIKINLNDNKYKELVIYKDDDINELVNQFCCDNSINEKLNQLLINKIKHSLNKLNIITNYVELNRDGVVMLENAKNLVKIK